MLYVQLAILAAAFALGWGSGWKSQEATVQALKAGIAQANSEAALQLQVSQTKVAQADSQALALKEELENAHDSFIRTANARFDLAERLRESADCQSRQNRVPATTDSGVSVGETIAKSDFQGSVARVVDSADDTLEYAKLCQTLIKANCGIAKDTK